MINPVREYRTIVNDSGDPGYVNRILIGIPSTGTFRAEWVQARYGQTIPINWSQVEMMQFVNSYIPLRYQVADAQNLIVKQAVELDFEWCFRGDTIVETMLGGKKIRDVIVGDIVKTHLGNYRPVTRVMKKEIKQRHPTIWIRTKNGVIKCTNRHPFLTRRGWVDAKDLQVSDRLLYPHVRHNDTVSFDVTYNTSNGNGLAGTKKNGVFLENVEVTRDLARFMGLYLAEGHSERDAVCFTFNNKRQDLIDFTVRVCQDVFGRTPTVRTTWATQVRLNIRNLTGKFKEWFGSKAPKKRIPSFVFNWGFVNRLEFLVGYLDGDGSWKADGCSYSSASSSVMDSTEQLAIDLGLEQSPAYTYDNDSPYVTNYVLTKNKIHMSRLSKKSMGKVLDLVGAVETEDYLEVPIERVESHPLAANLKDNAVYNLEVAGDNSYIADCAAVHNCLLFEHDVLPPPNAFATLNRYMRDGKIPVVSGLYYSRSRPSEPLVFKGRGNGAFVDFEMGDMLWVDGVPTGFLLIHGALLRAMWAESEEYTVYGQTVRRVFNTPRNAWFDPESGQYNTTSGTSDLDWCTRVMKEGFFAKAGWDDYQDMQYPFLIDTANLFCKHINPNGEQFP